LSADADAKLVTQTLRITESRAVGLDHDLDSAGVVPQANENKAAKVTAATDPATEYNWLTG
jgi:hypothetical protein